MMAAFAEMDEGAALRALCIGSTGVVGVGTSAESVCDVEVMGSPDRGEPVHASANALNQKTAANAVRLGRFMIFPPEKLPTGVGLL